MQKTWLFQTFFQIILLPLDSEQCVLLTFQDTKPVSSVNETTSFIIVLKYEAVVYTELIMI